MKVVRASEMGMCFGVKDALHAALQVERPHEVTVMGELVHNERVVREVAARGFVAGAAPDVALPATARALVTAHGISDATRARLVGAGISLVDTTCPLVRRVHEAARQLANDGYFVVVIGKRAHVEVRGITGDLQAFDVVGQPGEARAYDADRIGLVCQSTTPPDLARAVRAAVEERNPGKEIRYADTICRPTRDRQEALRALLGEVQAVVVVGGHGSNNTRELCALAAARGVPALQVAGAAEVDAAWVRRFEVVGLTAGTSTLDATIDEVHRTLLAVAAATPVEAVRCT